MNESPSGSGGVPAARLPTGPAPADSDLAASPAATPAARPGAAPSSEQTLRRLLEFERLVTELSTGFINLADGDVDDAIDDALRSIGCFAGVDRSYVFLFSEDLALATNTHEWCAPGIDPEIDNLQGLPTDGFAWFMERFLRFDEVYVPAVADLPLDDGSPREFLESQEIQALVAVPLLNGSRLIGFLGFDSVRCSRTWNERELTLLRLVGDIFANAIQRRRTHQVLARTEAELRTAQKLEALGRLAGGIAHDFNNLLTTIGGNASLLGEQLDTASPLRDLIEEIAGAVSRASSLTRQLLAFGRPGTGEPEVLNLSQVIAEGRSLYRRCISEDVRLEFELAPDLRNLKIDRGQIEQVLLNLLVNARDAVEPGGRIVMTTSNVATPEERDAGLGGEAVRLTVEDDGRGMDQAVQSRIFEPFFTTKEVGQGTGLGLSTVYGVVHRHQGSIRVESKPGEGSRFEITFPAAAAPVTTRQALQAAQVRTGTVLVVEDERPVRALIGKVLRSNGFEVLEAHDGTRALEVAASSGRPIDLLVTDVVMPRMGGAELDRAVRQHHPGIKTLFISGYPGPASGERVAVSTFLQKPFTPTELLQAIGAVMGPEEVSPPVL